MVLFLVCVVILVIIGFLFHIGAAFGSEKDRQNQIFEEELFQRQLSLDNQLNEKKKEAVMNKTTIRQLPTYFSSLTQSQN